MSNKDGLRYPSIDALLEKIPSKYKLVYAASKVARVLEEANLEVEDASSEKSIGVALEEIIAGRVDIEFE
ncbi:MAG TPA: DNA-directed RNA polymerase subunit omega [Acholeplasmataceae bacterium]|nr:DNA-directed RNA polymerase subunit omega [Acholeplasmataceae bacterium]